MNYRRNNSTKHFFFQNCIQCCCFFVVVRIVFGVLLRANTHTHTHTFTESFHLFPARACVCVCRLRSGFLQSDRDSPLIPIFQLGVSGAWLAAAGAQLRRRDGEEAQTNREEGREGRGEVSFPFLGSSVVASAGKCGNLTRIWVTDPAYLLRSFV